MTNPPWRPLSVRESGQAAGYDGPFEDVPEWLFGPLWDWITNRYPLMWERRISAGFTRMEHRPGAPADYRRIGMALGVSLEPVRAQAPTATSMQSTLYAMALRQPSILLDVADYWLVHDSQNGPARYVEALEGLLGNSRSVWTVERADTPYLARRVTAEARDAMIALGDTGRAAEHLARAWRALYGRSPNPSEGYRDAVKAVEVAAKPVVSPDNGRTTLGTIIRDMRARPEKWAVGLKHPEPSGQLTAVVGMLDLLWSGQSDRHGDPDPAAPLDVAQDEAEAALHLALTLVHWFTRGVVTLA